MNITSTTIWNVLGENTVLTARCYRGQPRKAAAVDGRNTVRTVEKNTKTTVNNITINHHRAGKSSKNSKVRLEFINKYRDKSFGAKMNLYQSDRKAKAWRTKDLLMIQTYRLISQAQ